MDVNEIIREAVGTLNRGGVILYPTDTIWGLGCDATDGEAVARIFEIKRRAESKSLVLLVRDLDMVARYVREVPSIAVDLVEVNDAPMTIIYPGAQGLAEQVVAEDGSVGMRIPLAEETAGAKDGGGAFCRELLRCFRKPLVSTSANISGEPAPAGFDGISPEILDAVDFVVPKRYGNSSTGRASQIIKVGLKGEVQVIRA